MRRTIEVDVDLSEIDDDDLADEVRFRGLRIKLDPDDDPEDMRELFLEYLEGQCCPPELLEPMRLWLMQPGLYRLEVAMGARG